MSENVKPGQSSRRPNSGERHPPGRARPQETKASGSRQKIDEFVKKLTEIYDVVEASTAPVLDPEEYANLSIDCQELKLNRDGSYADPPPQPRLFNPSFPNVVNHPIDFKKKGDKKRRDHDNMHIMLKHCVDEPSMAYSSAGLLCDMLDWELFEYPRKGINESLASKSNWRQSGDFRKDAVFHRVFWDELFYPSKISYSPTAAFVRYSKNEPHLMFSMKHDIKEDENLLRGEFLAITAAIITRLGSFASQGHIYTPILVFSFMGHLQGRILQAYYDGTSVVIRKTNLYHFCPENSKDLFCLFVQQMSSTPVGHTQEISGDSSKKTPQGPSQDLPLRQRTSNIR